MPAVKSRLASALLHTTSLGVWGLSLLTVCLVRCLFLLCLTQPILPGRDIRWFPGALPLPPLLSFPFPLFFLTA